MPRKDAEARKAYDRERYYANRERVLVERRAYRAANPDKIKALNDAYYAANSERLRAYATEYRRSHDEHYKQYFATHRETHREEMKAYLRAYYAENRERSLAQNAEWHRKHPGMRAHYSIRRRIRVSGNGGSHTLAEWNEKCALLGNVCIYCGEAKRLTRDHKVPISRGGSDDIANIVPACHSCNSTKRTMTAGEFISRRLAA